MKKLLILVMLLIPFAVFSQILRGVISSERSADPINIADSITANIVSIYKFDETTGLFVEDSYGINHGANENAIINRPPLTNDLGQAYEFDGTNSYVDFNAILIDTFPFSISMYVKFDTINYQYLFSSHYSYRYWGMTMAMTGTAIDVAFGQGLGVASTSRKSLDYNFTFEVDTVYHIVVTSTDMTSAATKVYVNNSEVSFSSSSGTATEVDWDEATAETRLGHAWATTGNRFRGIMDLVVVSDTIFTSGDRAFLYTLKN